MQVVPFYVVDDVPNVDPNWLADAMQHMTLVEREGAGPGSLTEEGLRYAVLNGNGVLEHAPKLWSWAEQVCLPLVCALTGQAWRLSPHTVSAVNVNALVGSGESYERHLDSCPLTMITFFSDNFFGGELECEIAKDCTAVVTPKIGRAVIFDGSRIPHAVRPLQSPYARLSVPVAFYPLAASEILVRDDLDDHLYAAGKQRPSKQKENA